jgi:DNA-binding CsgD family transcriptional regulator
MGRDFADLCERDLRAALGALNSLSAHSRDCAAFVDAAFEQLTGIVASDLTTLSICDLERGTRSVIGRKAESLSAADREAFDRHFREHPLVRFHGSHPAGPTQRITDCLSVASFRKLAVHADYYRRIGINYVMALPLQIDHANVVSVVFNRGRSDFTDRERATLDVIRRPLAGIYRGLMACEEAGIGLRSIGSLAAEGGWQMMRVSFSGRILEASPAALGLLERFFPGTTATTAKLPDALHKWFAHTRHWGLDRPAISTGGQFACARLGMRLRVHFIPDADSAATGYLMMKTERIDMSKVDTEEFALSNREREVLTLVAEGKTNGEIAQVLSISARTVQKHLEHIFQKLGVETRMAAAIRAFAAADQGPTT